MHQVCKLDLYPDVFVSLCLFKNVKNSQEVKTMVIEGKLEGSLLNTKLILDPFQVLVAANKAVHQQKQNKLTTKSIYTEIIYNMSTTKRISDSLKTFGVGDEDDTFLLILLNDEEDKKMKTFQSVIDGELISLSHLSDLANIQNIKKIYNITEQELEMGSLLDSIVSRIAAKEIKMK